MTTNDRDNLPKHRTGRVTAWLDRTSLSGILVVGVLLYSIVPIMLSGIEWAAASAGHDFIQDSNHNCVNEFGELLYFNFITILTVGYGDYSPISIGRVVSVVEAIIGVVLFGVLIAVATIKTTLPPKKAIMFSKYGYYCLDDQRFLVIFVNTTTSILVNPEMCSYYRHGDDWTVRPAYRAPFIRGSVWTFFVDQVPLKQLVEGHLQDSALRFGITGQLGLATASAFVEYEPDAIIVIKNRSELTSFEGFRNADLGNDDVRRMFHYRPKDSKTLKEIIKEVSISVEKYPPNSVE